MTEHDTEVYQFISENEPVEQERVQTEFGERGLSALRSLMIDGRVSYGLNYKLVTER